MIEKIIKNWFYDLYNSIKKNPQNLLQMLVIPIIGYYIGIALLGFGIKTTIGYFFACLKGLPKIVEDPSRILKWGVGFAGTATILPSIFTLVLPQISKGTTISYFVAIFVLYVIGSIWWSFHKLKSE